ncbi:MAG: hypothetical protein ABSC56_11195 [Solirubrobacteraceae bacterium]
MAEVHIEDLRRTAPRTGTWRRAALEDAQPEPSHEVRMRVAHRRNEARIAGMSASDVPRAPVLVGELEGRAVAALSLSDGEIVTSAGERADEVVALLELRAKQLRRGPKVGSRS